MIEKIYVIGAIFLLLGLSGCITSDEYNDGNDESPPPPEYWYWELKDGSVAMTMIKFTSNVIYCADGGNPEIVFSSVMQYISSAVQKQDGSWKKWMPDDPDNTLTIILPNVYCYIKVDSDCILAIQKCEFP